MGNVMSAGQLIMEGGPLMIPIIACSVVAFGIILGKLVYFSRIGTDTHKLKAEAFDRLKNNRLKEALTLCDRDPSPVAKILRAGILKFGCSREEIKEAMDDVSLYEIPALERRFTALATIAHVSPLLGLLGTVVGMTQNFYVIKELSNSLQPVTAGDLAGGIAVALLTTVAGLTVAIPTFLAYNYLVSRVNSFVLEMERAATELVNFISHLLEAEASRVEPR